MGEGLTMTPQFLDKPAKVKTARLGHSTGYKKPEGGWVPVQVLEC